MDFLNWLFGIIMQFLLRNQLYACTGAQLSDNRQMQILESLLKL